MAGKRSFQIETPRGKIVTTTTKGGTVKAELIWNAGFGQKKSAAFLNAQEFVDSECLRHCDPLTPRLSGTLIKSGTLGTVIGSGSLEYLAPYARRQYYENQGNPKEPNRGKLWFERMKASKKETIRKGAGRIIDGK